MDKKAVLLLFFGIPFYSIGMCFSFPNIFGRISALIGGILLGIFFVRIGARIKIKRIVLGSILKGFGMTFIGLVIFIMSSTFIFMK